MIPRLYTDIENHEQIELYRGTEGKMEAVQGEEQEGRGREGIHLTHSIYVWELSFKKLPAQRNCDIRTESLETGSGVFK